MPLKVSQGMGAWIDDFKKSDAPQFKGKSDKERRDQAIAAYLDAKRKAKSEDTDEGYVSHAQRKAVWASRADGGKGHPDKKGKKESVEEKVDRDALAKAMAAYKAKGGKVTKAPAAKAQGYHGKDDPGKGIAGMMDRPDTKKIGTRKKVKSMEGTEDNNESLWDNIRKRRAAGKPRLKPGDKNYPKTLNVGEGKKEDTVNELSPDTKKSYTKKATTDLYGRGLRKGMDIERGSSSLGRTKVVDKDNDRKIKNRHAGIYRAQK